jgi:hypothetical protein
MTIRPLSITVGVRTAGDDVEVAGSGVRPCSPRMASERSGAVSMFSEATARLRL